MAPAVRSTNGIAYGGHSNTVVNAPSSIVAGDLLLVFFLMGVGGSDPFEPGLPSGFTNKATFSQIAGGSFRTRVWMYAKTATASEPSTYTFTHANNSTCATILSISDADLGTIAFTEATGTNYFGGSTATAPGILTTVDNSLILFVGSDWGSTTNNLVPPTGTTPTFTENWDVAILYVASGSLSPAGAIGNKTHVVNNSNGGDVWWAGLVAISSPGAAPSNVSLGNAVLDSGLGYIDTNADKIFICTAQPTTYAEAITTYGIGNSDFGVGAVAGAPAAATGGRKITTNAVVGGTVTAAGTPSHWAIVDSVNSLLLATGALSGGVAVTTSDGWSLDATTIIRTGALSAASVLYDAVTNAWIAAVLVAGGTVSTARRALVDALVSGLKTDGVWRNLDSLWLFAAENTASALVDIKARQLATAVNSPVFLANRGYLTSATAYINTVRVVPTAADDNGNPSNYQDNHAHIADWVEASPTNNSAILCGNLGSKNTYLTTNASGNYATAINDNSGTNLDSTASKLNSFGFLLGSRTASNVLELYLNGSSIASGSNTSVTPFSNANFVGGRNNFGTIDAQAPHRSAAFSIGAGLSAAEQLAFYNRLLTYMTGVGM